MSVVAGQMRPEDRGRLERILEARLDLENTGSLSWRAGRETASWRRLATQMVRGRPGVSPHGMGLPMEVFLRDAKLPFEFSGADVPLHFVGSGQVVTRLAAALAERGTPARAELRRAITEHFGCTVVPGGLERGYEEFAGPDGRTFRLPRRTPLGQAVFDEFLRHFALSATDYRLKVRPRLGWRSATTRLSQNERATGRSPSLGPA